MFGKAFPTSSISEMLSSTKTKESIFNLSSSEILFIFFDLKSQLANILIKSDSENMSLLAKNLSILTRSFFVTKHISAPASLKIFIMLD